MNNVKQIFYFYLNKENHSSLRKKQSLIFKLNEFLFEK